MTKRPITDYDIEFLNEAEQDFEHQRIFKRSMFLRMKKHGVKQQTIAKILEVRPETISNWGRRYDVCGFEGLLLWNYHGRVSQLSRTDLEQIREQHEEAPFQNGQALREYIEEHFGISYHLHWIHKLAKNKIGIDFVEQRRISTEDWNNFFHRFKNLKV